MPDCAYCGDTFPDEEGLLAHLRDEHEGELGAIDRRRVAALDGEDGGFPTGPIVLGGVILVAVGVIIYVTVFLGGSSPAGDGPGPVGSAHEHGTLEMRVMGEPVDFSQSQYQLQADRFHFEEGNGEIWHTHATGVTLSWAMDTLDIGVTEDTVTYAGTTYRDSDPNTTVMVEVNGEPVDPETYVLEGIPNPRPDAGDQVRIIVRETNSTS